MVDLVTRNLEHEIAAYAEFCGYRETEKRRRENEGLPTNVSREDWLADKRATLQSQMHDRRETRDASPSWKLRLW